MLIRYSLTEEDVVAFCEYHVATSPMIRRQMARARFLYPLWFLGCGVVLWFALERPAFPIAFSFVAVAWIIWWPSYWKRHYRKQVIGLYREGRNTSLFGDHELELGSEGPVAKSPSGEESKYRWSSIERVEQTPEYLFLYVSALQAIIVPRGRVREGNFEDCSRLCFERAA